MFDLHTHTIFSDGYHTPKELVLNSIENGIKVIGITDHHKAFFMDTPKYKSFENYISTINFIKEKYKNKIKVKAGIEINLNFNDAIGKGRIPYEELSKLDFVLLERVDGLATFEMPKRYHVRLEDIGEIVHKINCEIGLAHTDLLMLSRVYSKGNGIESGMDYVVSILKKYNLFWELNTSKEHEYFDFILENWDSTEVINLFQKLRNANIKIKAGTDTHFIKEDFNLQRLKLANLIATGELVPGREELPIEFYCEIIRKP